MAAESSGPLSEQLEVSRTRQRAVAIFKHAFGSETWFHDGQLEAIVAICAPASHLLIARKPAWGKTAAALAAAKILIEERRAQCVWIGPTEALRIEVERLAETMSVPVGPSGVSGLWMARPGEPAPEDSIDLLIVDEAQSVVDGQYDFRPWIASISRSLSKLSSRVVALSPTASPSVMNGITDRLGRPLESVIGQLVPDKVELELVMVESADERYRLVRDQVIQARSGGIVYARTRAEVHELSALLGLPGYDASLIDDEKHRIEVALREGQAKGVVVTPTLALGLNLPPMHWAISIGLPPSAEALLSMAGSLGTEGGFSRLSVLVASDDYQRDLDRMEAWRPTWDTLGAVRRCRWLGVTDVDAIAQAIHRPWSVVWNAVHRLDLLGDPNRSDEVAARHLAEQGLEAMQRWSESRTCLWLGIAELIGDPSPPEVPCGRCSNCVQLDAAANDRVDQALATRSTTAEITPIQVPLPAHGEIFAWALGTYDLSPIGIAVKNAKFHEMPYPDQFIHAVTDWVRSLDQQPAWLTYVPSRRGGGRLAELTKEVAKSLGIPCLAIIRRVRDGLPQKSLEASESQRSNVAGAFASADTQPGVGMLLDDVIDSGWTMSELLRTLKASGAEQVVGVALCSSRPRWKR